jgi:hypothetical protein
MTLPTLSVDRTHTLTLLHAELKHRRASCGNRKQGARLQRQCGSKEEFMFSSGSMTIGSSYHTKGPAK